MNLKHTITLHTHHSGEVTIAATERLAKRLRLEGELALGPEFVIALDLVYRILGGRVVRVRKLDDTK